MSLKENKAVVVRLFETENERNLALLDELMAPNYIDNAFQFQSLKEYKQMHTMTIDAFPDFHETVEDIARVLKKFSFYFVDGLL